MILRTDYRTDVFEGNRKYQVIQDGEGKSEILDVTEYSQEGDVFGPKDVNATNKVVNALNHVVSVILQASGRNTAAPYTQTVPIEGLTTEDNPTLVKVIVDGAAPEQVKAYSKAFGMIDDRDTADGQATFRCHNKKPTIDLTVELKGVQKQMGRLWIPESGGGADLDVITAAVSDVRKGKVIVDKGGNPLIGIMAEKGAATYYGQNYDQVIAADQYLTGNQTTVGDGNLQSWNIKRGMTIFGRADIFEGWLDRYYNISLDGNTTGINYSGSYTNYVNIGSTISFATNSDRPSREGVAFNSSVSFSSYGKLYVRYSCNVSLTVGVVRQGVDYGSWEVSTSNNYSIDSNTREVALDIFDIGGQPTVFTSTSGYSGGYSATIYRIILGKPAQEGGIELIKALVIYDVTGRIWSIIYGGETLPQGSRCMWMGAPDGAQLNYIDVTDASNPRPVFAYPPKSDIERLQEQVVSLNSQLIEAQLVLTEQYEANLALAEEVTNTQLALTEIYEGMEV